MRSSQPLAWRTAMSRSKHAATHCSSARPSTRARQTRRSTTESRVGLHVGVLVARHTVIGQPQVSRVILVGIKVDLDAGW